MLKLLYIEMHWQYFTGSGLVHKVLFNINKLELYNVILCVYFGLRLNFCIVSTCDFT